MRLIIIDPYFRACMGMAMILGVTKATGMQMVRGAIKDIAASAGI